MDGSLRNSGPEDDYDRQLQHDHAPARRDFSAGPGLARTSAGRHRGGRLPPSASVLMFWMARVNVAVRVALSLSRAASSGSIELS